MHWMAESKSSKPKKPKIARWQRLAMMDKEFLDVEGAATLLGVSTTTIYKQIPRSSRWNLLPVECINRSLLMRHEHLACALI